MHPFLVAVVVVAAAVAAAATATDLGPLTATLDGATVQDGVSLDMQATDLQSGPLYLAASEWMSGNPSCNLYQRLREVGSGVYVGTASTPYAAASIGGAPGAGGHFTASGVTLEPSLSSAFTLGVHQIEFKLVCYSTTDPAGEPGSFDTLSSLPARVPVYTCDWTPASVGPVTPTTNTDCGYVQPGETCTVACTPPAVNIVPAVPELVCGTVSGDDVEPTVESGFNYGAGPVCASADWDPGFTTGVHAATLDHAGKTVRLPLDGTVTVSANAGAVEVVARAVGEDGATTTLGSVAVPIDGLLNGTDVVLDLVPEGGAVRVADVVLDLVSAGGNVTMSTVSIALADTVPDMWAWTAAPCAWDDIPTGMMTLRRCGPLGHSADSAWRCAVDCVPIDGDTNRVVHMMYMPSLVCSDGQWFTEAMDMLSQGAAVLGQQPVVDRDSPASAAVLGTVCIDEGVAEGLAGGGISNGLAIHATDIDTGSASLPTRLELELVGAASTEMQTSVATLAVLVVDSVRFVVGRGGLLPVVGGGGGECAGEDGCVDTLWQPWGALMAAVAPSAGGGAAANAWTANGWVRHTPILEDYTVAPVLGGGDGGGVQVKVTDVTAWGVGPPAAAVVHTNIDLEGSVRGAGWTVLDVLVDGVLQYRSSAVRWPAPGADGGRHSMSFALDTPPVENVSVVVRAGGNWGSQTIDVAEGVATPPPSATPSPSSTHSPSSTPSPPPTHSRSATHSLSATHSSTTSTSASASASASPTASASPSSSSSDTPSSTATETATPSVSTSHTHTPSASNGHSHSSTPSGTPTSSQSRSRSGTTTSSQSGSRSGTTTSSQSGTLSRTPTSSQSGKMTVSGTASAEPLIALIVEGSTASPTASPSGSPSGSPTATALLLLDTVDDDDGSGASVGVIVGGAVAGVVFVVSSIVGVTYLARSRKKKGYKKMT